MLQSLDEVGDMVSSKKAPGENPTLVSSPSMNMAVNRAYLDSGCKLPFFCVTNCSS